jgi:hypothetical protein
VIKSKDGAAIKLLIFRCFAIELVVQMPIIDISATRCSGKVASGKVRFGIRQKKTAVRNRHMASNQGERRWW